LDVGLSVLFFYAFSSFGVAKQHVQIAQKKKKSTNGTNNDDICKGTNLTFGGDNVDVSFQYLKGGRRKSM
jgi:hypothetical protein